MDKPIEHAVCPICKQPIKSNEKLTGDIRWSKQDCYNEWYVHQGDILYKRKFNGHRFPD